MTIDQNTSRVPVCRLPPRILLAAGVYPGPAARWLRCALVIASVVALGVGSGASPSDLKAPAAVQLVETVPIETRLGNPLLPSAHDVWLELIQGATRSLDFEEFYLSNWPGEPMQDVLDAIGQAVRRGVRVRLILDARMHRTYPQPADSLGTVDGIHVRLLDMGKIAGGVQHAKYFLVDDRAVYLGSQNFDWRSLKHIHELGVLVRDSSVARTFGAVFDMDWSMSQPVPMRAGGIDSVPARRVSGSPGLHLALPFKIDQGAGDVVELWPSISPKSFTPDSTLWDRDAIVRTLDRARHEIVVQLQTYSPVSGNKKDDAIDQALRRAATRGVKVKLLVSDWETSGPAIGYLQTLARVPNIEAKLSTVPEWSGGYIPFARVEHCKYTVVDSLWTWIGTSNWEPGYFHDTRNVAVTLRNPGIALQARKVFEASWGSSDAAPVKPDFTYSPKLHGATPPPGEKAYGQ